MPVGRKATAARRRASRLAGLAWLPVWRPIQTATRRQASRLAGLVRFYAAIHPNLQGVSLFAANCGGAKAFFHLSGKAVQSQKPFYLSMGKPARRRLRRKQNPCKGCVCPTPTVRKAKAFFHLSGKTVQSQKPFYLSRGKPAHCQLRGSRAAIGSGGKKARPF